MKITYKCQHVFSLRFTMWAQEAKHTILKGCSAVSWADTEVKRTDHERQHPDSRATAASNLSTSRRPFLADAAGQRRTHWAWSHEEMLESSVSPLNSWLCFVFIVTNLKKVQQYIFTHDPLPGSTGAIEQIKMQNKKYEKDLKYASVIFLCMQLHEPVRPIFIYLAINKRPPKLLNG